MVLPVRPGIDQPDRGEIAVADQKILGAKRRAMGQIERELGERHEALSSRALRLVDGRAPCCWRGGSGAGAGS